MDDFSRGIFLLRPAVYAGNNFFEDGVRVSAQAHTPVKPRVIRAIKRHMARNIGNRKKMYGGIQTGSSLSYYLLYCIASFPI